MRNDSYDDNYNRNGWEEDAEYADLNENGVYEEYEEYDAYDDYDDYDLDDELSSENSFRIAMSVFNLISLLIGLAVILVLTALLFSLFNWVQRDLSQSLSVIVAPFNR